jgi:hypothetical protein
MKEKSKNPNFKPEILVDLILRAWEDLNNPESQFFIENYENDWTKIFSTLPPHERRTGICPEKLLQ